MYLLRMICTLAFVCSPIADAGLKERVPNSAENKTELYKPIRMDLSALAAWTKVIKKEESTKSKKCKDTK